MKLKLIPALLALFFVVSSLASINSLASVETYTIDTKGAHAGITFRIKHLGYSWLTGRFDDFSGSFKLDRENPENSSVLVLIETASINSNHGKRDLHLRGDKILDTDKFPQSKFESTRIVLSNDKTGTIYGNLTLHGVTKEVAINAVLVGGGDDPWGGFRIGFTGKTTISLADFGINFNLGPHSKEVELILDIEGVRQ